MTSTHIFNQITANGFEENLLPSLLDRKYSNQQTMHIAERRYTTRNVYVAKDADDEERAQLQADLQELRLGEDFVVGSQLEVQELGSSARAFNPTQFTDTVLGPIMKALNDFRGKQGTESSHQFANAKTSALLDQIGLSSFPLTVSRMLIDQLFRPWYEANPLYDPSYGGGYVAIPWENCDYDLNFGRIQKQDLDVKDQIELIKLAIEAGAVPDPVELRELLEDAGLGLRDDITQQINQTYNDYNAMPSEMIDPLTSDYQGIGGGPIPNNFADQSMGVPPMNNPIYDDMAINVRGQNPATENNPFRPNPYSAQPSDPRLNFTETRRHRK